jgi:hypothetical protein
MLRITTKDTRRLRTFRLEGRLEGPWAALLDECLRKALNGGRGKAPIRVDLSGVSYIDAGGKSVIVTMHDRGVEFTADDALTKAIIEEITAVGRESRRAVEPDWRRGSRSSSTN